MPQHLERIPQDGSMRCHRHICPVSSKYGLLFRLLTHLADAAIAEDVVEGASRTGLHAAVVFSPVRLPQLVLLRKSLLDRELWEPLLNDSLRP